jgi:hypothetical protein
MKFRLTFACHQQKKVAYEVGQYGSILANAQITGNAFDEVALLDFDHLVGGNRCLKCPGKKSGTENAAGFTKLIIHG